MSGAGGQQHQLKCVTAALGLEPQSLGNYTTKLRDALVRCERLVQRQSGVTHQHRGGFACTREGREAAALQFVAAGRGAHVVAAIHRLVRVLHTSTTIRHESCSTLPPGDTSEAGAHFSVEELFWKVLEKLQRMRQRQGTERRDLAFWCTVKEQCRVDDTYYTFNCCRTPMQ